MNPDLQSLGVGGVIAFLIVREVLTFVAKKRANGHGLSASKADLDYLAVAVADCRREIIDTRHSVNNNLAAIKLGVEVLVHDAQKGPRR